MWLDVPFDLDLCGLGEAGRGWATVAVGCQLGSQLGYRPPANPPDVAAAEGLGGYLRRADLR